MVEKLYLINIYSLIYYTFVLCHTRYKHILYFEKFSEVFLRKLVDHNLAKGFTPSSWRPWKSHRTFIHF